MGTYKLVINSIHCGFSFLSLFGDDVHKFLKLDFFLRHPMITKSTPYYKHKKKLKYPTLLHHVIVVATITIS